MLVWHQGQPSGRLVPVPHGPGVIDGPGQGRDDSGDTGLAQAPAARLWFMNAVPLATRSRRVRRTTLLNALYRGEYERCLARAVSGGQRDQKQFFHRLLEPLGHDE